MTQIRSYGISGPTVVVVHGGPGSSGSMAPIARALSDRFRVIEPFQRADSASVAAHVADLHGVVELRCPGERPALVGHSWGAMLALAYAAGRPESAGPLVLVGCGTFDIAARARMRATVEERMDPDLRRRMESLEREFPEPNQRMRALGELTLPLYSYDLISTEVESATPDEPAARSRETWDDMVRLQNEGVYPAAFAAIRTPVLMLHGTVDPHPGRMIRDSLAPFVRRLEYRELERCGHYPWIEKAAKEEFFLVLREWLARRLGDTESEV